MQNITPDQTSTPGRKSRLSGRARLLLLFWGVSVPALAGWAAFIAHTTPLPTPREPVRVAKAILPPRVEITAPAPAHAPLPVVEKSKPVVLAAPPPKPSVALIPTDKPVLAIVIEGIGYSDSLTQDALSHLPSPIALGMSPYLSDVQNRIHAAIDQHREVFVTLPMRGAHPEHVDEGPHALGYGNTQDQDRQQLAWCFERASGATGLTDVDENGDDQTSIGYATTPDFAPIAAIIEKRGLLYLAGSSDDGRQSRGMTATHWIDGDKDASSIDKDLAALLPTKTNPTPRELLMVGPLTPTAITRLATWLKDAGRVFTLVAPSALADTGQSSDKQADISRKSGPATL